MNSSRTNLHFKATMSVLHKPSLRQSKIKGDYIRAEAKELVVTDGGDPTKTAALLQVKLALVTAQGQLSECV